MARTAEPASEDSGRLAWGVIQRPMSTDSEVCQLGSPPSAPSTNSSQQPMWQQPTRIGEPMSPSGPADSKDSLPSVAGQGPKRYLQAAPIVPLREPTRYKLELGARIPVWDTSEEPEEKPPPGLAPGPSSILRGAESRERSLGAPARSSMAQPVNPSADPPTLEVDGYPEEFPSRLRAIPRDQDPGYPGRRG